jgi:hypothetical protein
VTVNGRVVIGRGTSETMTVRFVCRRPAGGSVVMLDRGSVRGDGHSPPMPRRRLCGRAIDARQ